MAFNIRLLRLVKYSGKNLTSFAKQFKTVTSESIRRFTKNPKSNPTLPFLAEILTVYPEIDPRWLLIGEGEMLAVQPEKKEEPKSVYADILSQLRSLERAYGNLENENKHLQEQINCLKGEHHCGQHEPNAQTG